MKALCWHGKSDMRYETVPDPKISGSARCPCEQGRLVAVALIGQIRNLVHVAKNVTPTFERIAEPFTYQAMSIC
jgi:hypothetical protein